MDKNTYETYEFLPANTSETEPEQFFVVQDDGSFLLNRQIQYVAQVQDVKKVLEDVQPCTVYGVGVASQQFFVDVDNSTDLISVSDQFILPESGNNLYTNSYLLQPSSSTSTQQIADVEIDQFKPPNSQEADIDIATHNNKEENNFTEITLSDEQYQTLEQKGWILLESNDKVFVLNTLGLHDITTNDKLVQKLRNEIQNDTNAEIDSGTFKIESVASQFPNLVTQPFADQPDTVEFVIGSNEEQEVKREQIQFIINDNNKENTEAALNNVEQMDISDNNHETEFQNNINEIAIIRQESVKGTNSIKIKTKLNFKDIPEKIVLGKTVNGKRLVAKVVKTLTNKSNVTKPAVDVEPTENTLVDKAAENQQYKDNNNGMSETELVSLIQQSVRLTSQTKTNEDDYTSAHSVVSQLLKVPNIRNSLIGHNLIITKSKNNKELGVKSSRSNVVLMTGRVTEKEDSSVTFELVPDLLLNIKTKSEEAMTGEGEHLQCIDHENETCTLFHVHITETKGPDGIVRVSVTSNKRQLSVNQMFDVKRRHPNTVFACSACATLFKSEESLKEHQENDCLEVDETLTIDTDKIDMVDAYAIIKTEKEKLYKCTQCEVQFTKLYACVRHVKTHLGPHQQKLDSKKDKELPKEEIDSNKQKKNNREVFKCKMCPSTYFHPATLSKHIVTRHIKVKSK